MYSWPLKFRIGASALLRHDAFAATATAVPASKKSVVAASLSGHQAFQALLWHRLRAVAVVATATALTATNALAEDREETERCRNASLISDSLAVNGAPATVEGAVLDRTTGMPIFGALVQWSFDRHTMTGSTDINGNFAFRLPVTNQRRGERVKVSLQSNLYLSHTASIRACPGTNKPVVFSLMPKRENQIATVQGQIIDSTTGRGIVGANIAILIGDFPLEGLRASTDSEGNFTIPDVGFSDSLAIRVTTDSPPLSCSYYPQHRCSSPSG